MSAPLPAEALALWLAACAVAPLPAEQVALVDAVGRVTAVDACSLLDSPVCAVAAMDGIAVTAGAPGLRRDVGDYDVVDTGDPLPPGRDAVVVREQVAYDGSTAVLPSAPAAGRHVRPRGEDVAVGDLLLPPGRLLRPVDVALLAAGGLTTATVRRRPHVVVVPTGDEVVPPGSTPGPGQVVDTNSLLLVTAAVAAGATATAVAVVPDDPAALRAAVARAAAAADLVVVGAGSSAGRDDHTAAVVRALGTVVVHGVAVRPGHPVVLGVVDGTPVLGSPGYPVSAALSFDLFAAPLLAALLDQEPPVRQRVQARLVVDVASPAGVEEWVRVRLGAGQASPLPGGAGALASLARADGLLRLDAATTALAAGDLVDVLLLHARSVGS